MAQLGIQQKRVEDVDTTDNFTPIPEGEYTFHICDSEILTGKSSGVPNLLLTLKVSEGNFEGKQVRHRLNLWSANKTAVDISEGELGQLCTVFGMPVFPEDSAELHNKHFNAFVKIIVEEGFDPKNEIKTKSFGEYRQVAPPTAAPAAVAPPTVAPAPPPTPAAYPPGSPAPAPAPAPAATGNAAPDWTKQG